MKWGTLSLSILSYVVEESQQIFKRKPENRKKKQQKEKKKEKRISVATAFHRVCCPTRMSLGREKEEERKGEGERSEE